MPSGLQVFLPLALLGTGFAAGGLMISVLGGAPLLLSLPVDRYIPVHKFLVTRFDPFMPISLVGGLVCDAVVIGLSDGTGRILASLAVLALLTAVTISLTKNVPINKWVYSLDPNRLPADWDRLDPRIRWRNWNALRAAFAVLALVLNTTIVGLVIAT